MNWFEFAYLLITCINNDCLINILHFGPYFMNVTWTNLSISDVSFIQHNHRRNIPLSSNVLGLLRVANYTVKNTNYTLFRYPILIVFFCIKKVHKMLFSSSQITGTIKLKKVSILCFMSERNCRRIGGHVKAKIKFCYFFLNTILFYSLDSI